jgi:hypothetical protein
MFDFLKPSWWIKLILTSVFIYFLILLPGFINLFYDKTLKEVGEMLTKNSKETLASASKIALEFYKSFALKKLKEFFLKQKEGERFPLFFGSGLFITQQAVVLEVE